MFWGINETDTMLGVLQKLGAGSMLESMGSVSLILSSWILFNQFNLTPLIRFPL